jgi:uncharacterized membrane protein
MRRLAAVDLLRGLVMVVMALDHARDYFNGFQVNPTDLATTTPVLFFTRWVTHFCAPVFVLLAGMGAALSPRPRRELASFLVTRGLWLALLEVTVVHFFWLFDVSYHFSVLQVIWAIGWSMVVLAGLIHLPRGVVAAIGLLLVAGHNLFDGVHGGVVWTLFHEHRMLEPRPGMRVWVHYPLLPWIGVMALGWALGPWVKDGAHARRLVGTGLAVTAAFVLLRAFNHYGDPYPWSTQARGATFTVLSFLNCEKYPPSLLYLSMTLGPALIALGLFLRRPVDRGGPLERALVTIGRVPLFYYLLHVLVIHLLAITLALVQFGHGVTAPGFVPPTYGLPTVYALWIGVVLALYPACRWYAEKKRQYPGGWLSYL